MPSATQYTPLSGMRRHESSLFFRRLPTSQTSADSKHSIFMLYLQNEHWPGQPPMRASQDDSFWYAATILRGGQNGKRKLPKGSLKPRAPLPAGLSGKQIAEV